MVAGSSWLVELVVVVGGPLVTTLPWNKAKTKKTRKSQNQTRKRVKSEKRNYMRSAVKGNGGKGRRWRIVVGENDYVCGAANEGWLTCSLSLIHVSTTCLRYIVKVNGVVSYFLQTKKIISIFLSSTCRHDKVHSDRLPSISMTSSHRDSFPQTTSFSLFCNMNYK